jgi:hypothetical protein
MLYHGIRREELCSLRPRDMQSRQGVMHFALGVIQYAVGGTHTRQH